MALSPLVVFRLGLCLEWAVLVQNGPLPKPSLQALPSFLVPLWEPVTVRCQGPPGVDSYRLERLRPTEYKDQATLVIPAMKAEFAGRYRCFYQMGDGWSPASEQLELVATGAFDKPSLSARPSTEVSPGGHVTLQCRATYGFDQFALYKEGDPRTSQGPGKWYEADFSLGVVTPAVGGTYRCYSFSSKSPYLWSAPSDPLELTVTGFPEASGKVTASPLGAVSALASSPESSRNITVPPRAPHAPIVPARQYYTQGNLVRICLGAVILVVLVGLLAEDWHSRKKHLLRRVRAVQRPLPPLPQARKSHGCEDGGRPDVCSPRACH